LNDGITDYPIEIMHLSAFAHYYLRKLLCQHLSNFGGLFTLEGGDRVPKVDANEFLDHFYAQSDPTSPQIRELEFLVQMRQTVESATAQDSQRAEELERRIFSVLGLRLGAVSSQRLPVVKPEPAYPSFRFHYEGRICEGIRYEHDLYGMISQFRKHSPFQAYQLASVLLDRDVACLVTTSETRSAVWVSLRSPSFPNLIQASPRALRSLIKFHSQWHKRHPRHRASRL
jgi:hypothetical protein